MESAQPSLRKVTNVFLFGDNMANECSFCGARHIETNMLVLNNGAMWVEFCGYCADNEVLCNAENNEVLLVRELFARCEAASLGVPFVRNPLDILHAEAIHQRDLIANAEAMEYDAYMELCYAAEAEHQISLAQLQADHWDNVIYRCEHSRRYTAPSFLAT